MPPTMELKAQGYTINIEHTDGGRRCFARAVVMAYKLL